MTFTAGHGTHEGGTVLIRRRSTGGTEVRPRLWFVLWMVSHARRTSRKPSSSARLHLRTLRHALDAWPAEGSGVCTVGTRADAEIMRRSASSNHGRRTWSDRISNTHGHGYQPRRRTQVVATARSREARLPTDEGQHRYSSCHASLSRSWRVRLSDA